MYTQFYVEGEKKKERKKKEQKLFSQERTDQIPA